MACVICHVISKPPRSEELETAECHGAYQLFLPDLKKYLKTPRSAFMKCFHYYV